MLTSASDCFSAYSAESATQFIYCPWPRMPAGSSRWTDQDLQCRGDPRGSVRVL